LTAHIHNTYGLGIANCYAAIECGAEIIETAFGGLGGCPFTKVAAGNVSTEDFVAGLQRNKVREDINIEQILEVSKEAQDILERKLESYVLRAGRIRY
jgi:hydroxymethylglutaryl-CoA lyase